MPSDARSGSVASFVAEVRARRVAAGLPEHITEEAVYRVLDGLLAGEPGGAVMTLAEPSREVGA